MSWRRKSVRRSIRLVGRLSRLCSAMAALSFILWRRQKGRLGDRREFLLASFKVQPEKEELGARTAVRTLLHKRCLFLLLSERQLLSYFGLGSLCCQGSEQVVCHMHRLTCNRKVVGVLSSPIVFPSPDPFCPQLNESLP